MPRNISNQKLLDSLKWRYATKQFDPARHIQDDDWETLEEALVLTPSSYGLQPWQFYVITDQAVKESLVEHSWGQRQVSDCSHLVVFAVWQQINEAHVDAFIETIVAARGVDHSTLAAYRRKMVGDVVQGPRSQVATDWAKLQAHIALGNFMTSAALIGIDTCPMEGFVPEKYDEVLGLDAKGLTAAVLCAAGYRAPSDKYGRVPKVRFEREKVVVRI